LVTDSQAICHEAGHVTAALHLGIFVEKVEVRMRFPRTLSRLDAPGVSAHQKYVMLAAGLAAQLACKMRPHPNEWRHDQEQIWERGGGDIHQYVAEAQEIISAEAERFKKLRALLTKNWTQEDSEFSTDETFDLATSDELALI
jgi:hypothetical protein